MTFEITDGGDDSDEQPDDRLDAAMLTVSTPGDERVINTTIKDVSYSEPRVPDHRTWSIADFDEDEVEHELEDGHTERFNQ